LRRSAGPVVRQPANPEPAKSFEIVKSPAGSNGLNYAGGCETITREPGLGRPAQNPSVPLAERAMVGMLSAAYDGGGYPWLGP
jgi:hypothetical protein